MPFARKALRGRSRDTDWDVRPPPKLFGMLKLRPDRSVLLPKRQMSFKPGSKLYINYLADAQSIRLEQGRDALKRRCQAFPRGSTRVRLLLRPRNHGMGALDGHRRAIQVRGSEISGIPESAPIGSTSHV